MNRMQSRYYMLLYRFNLKNHLCAIRCGDYHLPCLVLDKKKPIGVWGERCRRYLKEHKSAVYTAMLLKGTLDDHVAEIDRQAEEMLDRLIKQMAERDGITEYLKAKDQMA